MPPSRDREIWILVSLVMRVIEAVRAGRGILVGGLFCPFFGLRGGWCGVVWCVYIGESVMMLDSRQFSEAIE